VLVIKAIHDLFPWLRHLFADGAYAGEKLLGALRKFGEWSVEIVKRSAPAVGFEPLPRRCRFVRGKCWYNLSAFRRCWRRLKIVLPGLVPGIHAFISGGKRRGCPRV
jgi:transposase